ncbi:MAG: hypothetical protein L0219_16045 [Phycisphaerales bacterium]|nr:hypothetical protein [Phycisphaerales bacterium]
MSFLSATSNYVVNRGKHERKVHSSHALPPPEAAIKRSQSKHLAGVPLGKKAIITPRGFKYVDRTDYVPETDAPEGFEPKPKRPRKERRVNDPKYIAAAHELRDRYLEQVNADRLLPSAHGKYDVSRALEAAPTQLKQTPLLKAA